MPFRPPEKLIMGKARPTFGSEFGTGLGQGIGQVLQNKLQQMQQGQAYRQMGLPSTISQFDPQTQREFVKRFAGSQGNQAYSQAIGHVSRGEEIPPEIQSQLQPNQLLELEKFREQRRARGEEREYREEKTAISLIGDRMKSIADNARGADTRINRHNQIIQLARTGKLRAGVKYQVLSAVGLQDFWLNPETQAAKALIDSLAQDAATAFNTKRLTNLEVELYKGSLQTLKNTPEGIIAIAQNKILENEAHKVRDEARKQVLRENNGRYTRDMDDRIEEIVAPQLAQLSQQAMDNIAQAIEQGAGEGGTTSRPENPADDPGGVYEIRPGVFEVSDGERWIKTRDRNRIRSILQGLQ